MATIYVPHLVDGLGELVHTTVGLDEDTRPAQILLPVALYPVTAWMQPLVFQGGFPHLQLPQNDRQAIAIAEPYQ